MAPYQDMTIAGMNSLKEALELRYSACLTRGLDLNMARGKPAPDQLDLSMPMLNVVNSKSDLFSEGGTDCRNYGVLDGLPEARSFMGEICGARPEQVIVYGNSSLNVMFDVITHAWTHGICGAKPWGKLDEVKFLCPVPGYDRHFGITEHYGITMIPITMNSNGPDMDVIEELVRNDASIKGIWCVPKYSNPTGISYSDEVVRRFARLTAAAPDFRIFWDNAYVVHHVYQKHDEILDILPLCEAMDNPDIVYQFCSTSKITFPGAGIAAFSASLRNIRDIKAGLRFQTIGHDKINQLRHIRFFGNMEGLEKHMKKQATLIRPKFDLVLDALEAGLGGAGIGSWTTPRGGYFISFDALPGCARDIIKMCADAGVTMTNAGATYPYGVDPEDRNIRIAPTYPTIEDLAVATEVFIICVKLVSLERMLSARA